MMRPKVYRLHRHPVSCLINDLFKSLFVQFTMVCRRFQLIAQKVAINMAVFSLF